VLKVGQLQHLGQGNASTYLAQPGRPSGHYFQNTAGAKSIRAQPDGAPIHNRREPNRTGNVVLFFSC
jgi:hypothetical protein